jgi:hypothetical protein
MGKQELTKTNTRKPCFMRQTVSSRRKTRTGRALGGESGSVKRRMTTRQRLGQLENEVHQTMALLNTETGKPLNYNQFMNNPTYKKK